MYEDGHRFIENEVFALEVMWLEVNQRIHAAGDLAMRICHQHKGIVLVEVIEAPSLAALKQQGVAITESYPPSVALLNLAAQPFSLACAQGAFDGDDCV